MHFWSFTIIGLKDPTTGGSAAPDRVPALIVEWLNTNGVTSAHYWDSSFQAQVGAIGTDGKLQFLPSYTVTLRTKAGTYELPQDLRNLLGDSMSSMQHHSVSLLDEIVPEGQPAPRYPSSLSLRLIADAVGDVTEVSIQDVDAGVQPALGFGWRDGRVWYEFAAANAVSIEETLAGYLWSGRREADILPTAGSRLLLCLRLWPSFSVTPNSAVRFACFELVGDDYEDEGNGYYRYEVETDKGWRLFDRFCEGGLEAVFGCVPDRFTVTVEGVTDGRVCYPSADDFSKPESERPQPLPMPDGVPQLSLAD